MTTLATLQRPALAQKPWLDWMMPCFKTLGYAEQSLKSYRDCLVVARSHPSAIMRGIQLESAKGVLRRLIAELEAAELDLAQAGEQCSREIQMEGGR